MQDLRFALRQVRRSLGFALTAVLILALGIAANVIVFGVLRAAFTEFFPSRMAAVALGLFGAFGLLLSIAGTFGLASYTVSKRLRELSIRVALGAHAKQILSAALGRMLILLGSGCVIGIVLGMVASRLLSAIVYQASAQDPLVLAAVVLTLRTAPCPS